MLLKEDYFRDLELTDNDIDVSDQINNVKQKYNTPKELIDHMLSEYSNCISFTITNDFKKFNIFEYDLMWENVIPQLCKRLAYVLNVYGLKCSEPVFLYGTRTSMSFYWKTYHIMYFNGYAMISPYKTKGNLTDNFVHMNIYFNLPKITTYKAALVFIKCLLRYIWKTDDSRYFDSFSLRTATDSLEAICKSNRIYISKNIKTDLKSHPQDITYEIKEILNFFFPENKEDIDNEYSIYSLNVENAGRYAGIID